MSSGSSVEDRSDAAVVREGFFGDYYEHLAEEDSRAYSPELLIARATKHRDVAQSRRPGNAVVEIAGEPERSVVYIVTDDMPFLVDSVNAELVRQNCAIRLVMHPLFVVNRDRESGELSRFPGSLPTWASPVAIPQHCQASPISWAMAITPPTWSHGLRSKLTA